MGKESRDPDRRRKHKKKRRDKYEYEELQPSQRDKARDRPELRGKSIIRKASGNKEKVSLKAVAFTSFDKETMVMGYLRNLDKFQPKEGKCVLIRAEKMKIWAQITEDMYQQSKIKRSIKSVQDKFCRWRSEVKVNAMFENKYSKGTGGGPSFDDIIDGIEGGVESFLEEYRQRNSRQESTCPTEIALTELMLATLCKDQVSGLEGGIEAGTKQLEELKAQSKCRKRRLSSSMSENSSDEDSARSRKSDSSEVIVLDVVIPAGQPTKRPKKEVPSDDGSDIESPPFILDGEKSPARSGHDDFFDSYDFANENVGDTNTTKGDSMTEAGYVIPVATDAGSTSKKVDQSTQKHSGISQTFAQTHIGVKEPGSQMPIMYMSDLAASHIEDHHLLFINTNLAADRIVKITRLSMDRPGLIFHAVAK